MKQFLNLKRLTPIIVTLLAVSVLAALLPTIVSANASGAGSSCTLPDGTTGTVQNDGNTCCPTPDQNGSSSSDMDCLFTKYINPVIDLLSALVGVVVVIAVIAGAIEFSTAGGDPQRAASGRRHIMSALLALLAFVLLYVFLEFLVPGGSLNG
jgi:hypothetical protein